MGCVGVGEGGVNNRQGDWPLHSRLTISSTNCNTRLKPIRKDSNFFKFPMLQTWIINLIDKKENKQRNGYCGVMKKRHYNVVDNLNECICIGM